MDQSMKNLQFRLKQLSAQGDNKTSVKKVKKKHSFYLKREDLLSDVDKKTKKLEQGLKSYAQKDVLFREQFIRAYVSLQEDIHELQNMNKKKDPKYDKKTYIEELKNSFNLFQKKAKLVI